MSSEGDDKNTHSALRLSALYSAATASDTVSGLTHNFYRYPARFSPLFAREVIRAFSRPGDLVFDPFMGGGTTLVEARALGRYGLGTDISSLAVFVAKAKTELYKESDFNAVRAWADSILPNLNLRNRPAGTEQWIHQCYPENMNSRLTWPVRKTIELALSQVSTLKTRAQEQLVRCTLLRTAQWALDCRTKIPSAKDLRQQFLVFLDETIEGARQFLHAVSESETVHGLSGLTSTSLHTSVIGIESDRRIAHLPPPSLILTSPPYPGVHVLYHRWQIGGRKETPAPFWIANCQDGYGASFYTFGDREQQDLRKYYETALSAYRSIAAIADEGSLMVQLVAFAEPTWQLPRLLNVMGAAGFEELRLAGGPPSPDGRLWRTVPNRKWYATLNGATASSKEVVLFHRLSRTVV